MEDLGFDLSGLLSDEEAEKIFSEAGDDSEVEEQLDRIDNEEIEPAEEEESTQPSEKVGEENKQTEKEAVRETGAGSSPDTFYSSIASALKKDGIFSDLEDTEVEGVKTPEDFAQLFEKIIEARESEDMKRVKALLDGGVEPDVVKKYEQTISYLDTIEDEQIDAEGDEGENLRKSLIYNDLINRGYTRERANREIEKSFKSGSDIDDAKDALEALKSFYSNKYKELQENTRKQAEEAKNRQKAESDKFRKMITEDELKFGDTVLDKKTCQRVFDAVSKPVYKDKETGQYLTAVQKFQRENPLEFLKQLGMWYVLTDGGKNPGGLIKDQVRVEKNKHIRELERKINTTQLNDDGTLKYAGSKFGDGDPLLDDGWKVGFGE